MQDEVTFVVWGPLALFTRPESRSDRVSYPVITPSAARGVCDAVCFKPEMEWEILQIAILSNGENGTYPKTMSLKRNEVKNVAVVRSITKSIEAGELPSINTDTCRTQRSSLLLKDVSYMITVRPRVWNTNARNYPQKYVNMLTRRLRLGQFYHKPYFGCREFHCDVRLADDSEVIRTISMDCGRMIHHLDHSSYPPIPIWFHAVVRDGILNCSLQEQMV